MNDTMIKNAGIILNEDATFGDIKKSIDNLYLELSQISKITGTLKKAEHGTILPDGEALSPQTAAGCIFDYVRTTKFLRGIKKATDKQLKTKTGNKICVMYAGTGPFAPLLIPLIPFYKESEIEINVIDFHTQSIASIISIIEFYGYANYFDEIITADAITYQNIKNKIFDMIIIETMQKGLYSEPQVALTNHFSQFLNRDGLLVPEEIKITAALSNLSGELSSSQNKWESFWMKFINKYSRDHRIFLKEIFKLDKNVGRNYGLSNITGNKIMLPTVKVEMKNQRMKNLILLTEIKIFEDIILSEEDETGLTNLYFDKNVPPIEQGMEIQFSYLTGSRPRFMIEVL